MKYNQIISLLKSNADTYLFILPFSLFILIKIIKLSESLLTKNLQSLRKNKDLGKLNKVVISKSSSSSKKPLKPKKYKKYLFAILVLILIILINKKYLIMLIYNFSMKHLIILGLIATIIVIILYFINYLLSSFFLENPDYKLKPEPTRFNIINKWLDYVDDECKFGTKFGIYNRDNSLKNVYIYLVVLIVYLICLWYV